MTFESVDALQKTLAEEVFHYATDRKKAAGRALGTLVEIVTLHTLLAWGLRDHIVIERSVPEFANPDISHNVEFSLHPVRARHEIDTAAMSLPLTAIKLKRALSFLSSADVKSTQVLSRDSVKRNSAILLNDVTGPVVANVDTASTRPLSVTVCELSPDPFAIVECKRVGIEEGMRKGPQTIEKAKQGAYVAQSVSSLQKVRLRNGTHQGIIERSDGTFHTSPYDQLLREVIDSPPEIDLRGVILTIGVVSNHGNWFTSEYHNKELRVLAQSYDWLLFLTDVGLSQFIDRLLLHPTPGLAAARDAFLASYSGERGHNRFTKVRMAAAADESLQEYFRTHATDIESWFNVISPLNATLPSLRFDLRKLATKDWSKGDSK